MKERLKKVENSLKNFLLRLVLLLFKAKSNNNNIDTSGLKRILLIRLNRIGDALVTTPLIKLIKENTRAEITVLADQKNYIAFNNNPYIKNTLVYVKGFKLFMKLVHYLNSQKFDLVIDAHDDVSFTVSVLIGMLRSRYKLALKKKNYSIFTHTVDKPDPKVTHVILRVAKLAKALNISYNEQELNVIYEVASEKKEKVRRLLNGKFSQKKFLVGINISAGSDARFWGVENFRKLEDWLIKNYDCNLLLICSTRDVRLALAIARKQEFIYFTPEFDEFAALIGELDLLFSPDTATVHLASIYSVPVFGLYVKYMTDDIIWSPFRSDFDFIVTTEPNLANVTFEQVIEKFKPFLEKHLK